MPVGAAADSSSLAAEFVLFSPNGKFSPEPNQTVACKPSGYHMAPPSSFYKSYKSYKSYASATPPQHAYRRCHQVALHYPAVNLPVALPLRHIITRAIPLRLIFARAIPDSGTANPGGITWRTNNPPKNSQKIPKIPMQAPRPRTPHTAVAITLPGIPHRHICARAIPDSGTATHGVSLGLPRRSPSGRIRAHPSCQTGQTGQTGQTQAPRPRHPHTAVA